MIPVIGLGIIRTEVINIDGCEVTIYKEFNTTMSVVLYKVNKVTVDLPQEVLKGILEYHKGVLEKRVEDLRKSLCYGDE